MGRESSRDPEWYHWAHRRTAKNRFANILDAANDYSEVRRVRREYQEVSSIGGDSDNPWIRRSSQVPGWLFPGEHEFIYEQCVAAPPGHFIEIGVLFGKSASIIAGAIVDRKASEKLFAIDPFSLAGNKHDEYVHRVTHGEKNSFATFEHLALKLGYFEKVIPIATYSTLCLPHLDIRTAFAFIDGCHEEEDVWEDFSLIYPKLVPGAIVLFHDALNGPFPGIMRAIGRIKDHYSDSVELGQAGTILSLQCKAIR